MKIEVRNLGTIKQAELSLGDFTIICGDNNTGKTYITYSIYGFLSLWRDFLSFDITDDQIDELFNSGVLKIEILDYLNQVEDLLQKGCHNYQIMMPYIVAGLTNKFKDIIFKIEVNIQESIISGIKYQQQIKPFSASRHEDFFAIFKDFDSTLLNITLLSLENSSQIPKENIKELVSDALTKIIFSHFLPHPFIFSAERTGILIFRQELNLDTSSLGLFKNQEKYSLPINHNISFIKELEQISVNESFIQKEFPQLLAEFSDIIGGHYTIDSLGYDPYFIPKNRTRRLSMDESSSAVRSLIMIGFYLKHQAQKGDLLMIDEPELNLHPENQRRVARLLARLVNIGIKVFVTTHSDYFIKELNTLIMLNQDKPYLQQIAEEEGYRNDELLNADQVKVYVTEKVIEKIEEKPQKTGFYALTEASITQELGIEIKSFDTAIETMNRIQEAIIWGE